MIDRPAAALAECNAAANQILAALPDEVRRRLTDQAKLLTLPAGTALHEPGQTVHSAYFPSTCVVSLMYTMQSGASAEIGTVGPEGMVGVAAYLEGGRMPIGAVVRNAGRVLVVPAAVLLDEFKRSERLRVVLLRYMQVLLVQIAQLSVCNRHHSIEQQLCRWLLRARDRCGCDELQATHESIARLIGVRREGITTALSRLHSDGLLRTARGRIALVDPRALQARACECYRILRDEQMRPTRGGAAR